ncbi:MAG TPA: hypothetical protein VGO75_17835, partial [Gemmatimonadaceae bacterium]|nr:hypothetical protein [Gemmatimonadaceae bacterium]
MNYLLMYVLATMAPTSSHLAYAPTPIALVVSQRSSIRNLSMDDLRRIYLGEAGRVDNVQGIQVVEFIPIRREFYERVLIMSEARVKRHWIGLLFAGEATVPPKEFRELADLREYLAGNPSAIAFVPASQVSPSMKVVSVNGFLPSSA